MRVTPQWFRTTVASLSCEIRSISRIFIYEKSSRKFLGLVEPSVVYTIYHSSFLGLVYFLPLLILVMTYSRVILLIRRLS